MNSRYMYRKIIINRKVRKQDSISSIWKQKSKTHFKVNFLSEKYEQSKE